MSISSLLIPGPVALMNTELNQSSISAVEHNCDLEMADDGVTEVVTGSMFLVPELSAPQFTFAGLPSRLPMSASCNTLMVHNLQLYNLLEQVWHQMEIDYALKKLMDWENGCLRGQLFDKSHKPTNKMTSPHA
jgi:hypothetical protein